MLVARFIVATGTTFLIRHHSCNSPSCRRNVATIAARTVATAAVAYMYSHTATDAVRPLAATNATCLAVTAAAHLTYTVTATQLAACRAIGSWKLVVARFTTDTATDYCVITSRALTVDNSNADTVLAGNIASHHCVASIACFTSASGANLLATQSDGPRHQKSGGPPCRTVSARFLLPHLLWHHQQNSQLSKPAT